MHVQSFRHRLQAALLAVVCTVPCGCASVAGLQDLHYSCCNKYRASEAWKCNFSRDERNTLGEDFELGFKKGYFDTSMGKDCRLPPVAPPRYWSARYQSCSGQCAVQDWFRGYQHGITAAQSGSCPSFAAVPVSPDAPVLNKSGCGACYSPDHCNCNTPDSGLQGCGIQGCNSDSYLQSTIPVEPTEYAPQPKETQHQSHEAMIDMSDAQAIIPASFGSSAGMIGGYGVKVAD